MASKLDPFERPTQFSKWAEAPYHPRFIEKLLLAIIDAYPSDELPEGDSLEKDRQRRLRSAIRALFGRKPPAGPISKNDLRALTVMAKKVMRDRNLADFEEYADMPGLTVDRSQIPGDRTLAREQRDPNDSNAEERRRKSFRKYRDYFQTIGNLEAHVEEDEIFDDLGDVYRIFRKYNIDLNIDTEKLGMLSFVIRTLPPAGA
jgi:hypothetical protein